MIRNLITITTGIFLSVLVCAQEVVKPKDVKLVYNTVGTPSISIDFSLDLAAGEQMNTDFWIDAAVRPAVELKYGDKPLGDCTPTANLFITKSGFGLKISGFSQTVVDRFLTGKDNQIAVIFTTDIDVALMRKQGEAVATHLLIKKEVANQMIADNLKISDEDKAKFLTSLNNFYYYENFADFGIEPAQDSLKSNYFLTLRFQNSYNRKSVLRCGNAGQPLYWSLQSRVSTNFEDSLNFVNFYPFNYRFEKFDAVLPFQLNIKAGHESNQTFSRRRVAADMGMNFIIPNLINLTTAKSNRLRLKPVLQTGLKGYHDYSVSDSSFTSGQLFLNGYYYIPVFNNYAIVVEGKTFYDFSDENNPDKKIQGNYSITLGAEIPKTGFKAMFKYIDGKTDINFKQGKVIALGLLIDFFQEKQKENIPAM